jgi:hypothetical protein
MIRAPSPFPSCQVTDYGNTWADQVDFSSYTNPSLHRDDDVYNDRGQNISAQERRQDLERWITVNHHKM